MTSAPLIFYCTGDALVPLRRFDNRFKSEFEKGKRYQMEEVEERSWRSHKHFFASVHDAWMNLPEEYAQEFADAEHLRKHALIMTGWRNVEHFAFETEKEAMRFATFYRRRDTFAIVRMDGSSVTVATAKSQKSRGEGRMSKEDFQKSKESVLEYVWGLCGVDRETGEQNTGRAA